MSVFYNFGNRVALVTGGGSGIGEAIAVALSRAGAQVIVADIDEIGGMATVNAIQEEGCGATFFKVDVSKQVEVEALITDIVEQFGRLDYAVNNAGTEGIIAPTADYPVDEWDRVMGINLKGLWLCMRSELPVMVNQGYGSIVNIGSVAGLVGAPGLLAYSASKHGVIGITKTAALDYANSKIRINCVAPSFIDTPMTQRSIEKIPALRRMLPMAQPLGRLGTSNEIADAVMWLLSDAASYTTGTVLSVDGGFVAR